LRASSRGAEPKTSIVLGSAGSGSLNQRTNPSMPAWATRVIQDRSLASSRPNQACRASISATVAVAIAPVTADSRRPIAARVLAEGSSDLMIPRVVATMR
jgi:hypothetical protein